MIRKTIIISILICLGAMIAVPVLANNIADESGGTGILNNLKEGAKDSYNTDEQPDQVRIANIAGSITKILLGFVGVIFMILIITAGFQWMTAGGNSEVIDKARKRIINATIGLIIVLAAWIIVNFVMDVILNQAFNIG